MLNKIVSVLSVPELRVKIYITCVLLAIYRMGFWLPLPIVNHSVLNASLQSMQGGGSGPLSQILQTASLFSASQVGYSTIFGLGIMPYISCSIVFQLLATVYPPLERLQKDGESGRRRVNEITRQCTVLVSFIQSFFWIKALSSGSISDAGIVLSQYNTVFFLLSAAVTMTAGTMFLVWIGEQIDAFGLGNGVSLIIMAGILAHLPSSVFSLFGPIVSGGASIGSVNGIDRLFFLFSLFVAVVFFVVFVTQAQRRVAVQTAKGVRAASLYSSSGQFLPIKLNQSGVMPIIFASSLLMIPGYLYHQFLGKFGFSYLNQVVSLPVLYFAAYSALIFFFSYFWAAVTFNPKEIAQNLKEYGSFIPGYRPGDRTASYLEYVVVRVTFLGAFFLCLCAFIPNVVSAVSDVDPVISGFYGGTGLLIVVSVSIDLIARIDSHLVAGSRAKLSGV